MFLESEMKDYLQDNFGEDIKCIKTRLKELSLTPQNYKTKDIVYFKETKIKCKLGWIVSKQYRSAKSRKDSLFFPNSKLAYDYYIGIPNKLFPIVENVLDKFIPMQLENTFNQFVNIKDIGLGDSCEFKINH